MLIRPVRSSDLEGLIRISHITGSGMTSIPKDISALEALIEHSIASFHHLPDKPKDELYFFVLEDPSTGRIGGTCGIWSKTGVKAPVCFYKVETEVRGSKEFKVLHPVCQSDCPSEICSLYLLPEYRKAGLGKLLSYSRFHFIAGHRELFTDVIYAELRGFMDKNKHSPFWEGLGRHFAHMTFEEINGQLKGEKNSLVESMSRYPVYAWMLSKACRDAICKPHTSSKGALKMLMGQGFSLTGLCSTIDAGPVIMAEVDRIQTIEKSALFVVSEIVKHEALEGRTQLASRDHGTAFRACYAKVRKKRGEKVVISDKTAANLQAEVGSTIRLSPL